MLRLAMIVTLATAVAAVLVSSSAPAAVSCAKVAAPTGSDSAAGSAAAPFKTAQKLVDSLSAGQTGCLRAGVYTQGMLRFSKGGASGSPITLASYPGERATVAGGNVYVPKGSNFVTIRDLTVDGSGVGSPTVQVMAFDTVLSGNAFTNRNSGESCVLLGNLAGYGQARRTVVSGNRFSDCGDPADGIHDHGIYIESSVDAEVVDNLFWHAAAWAIQLYPDAQGTHIAHNVMDGSAGGIIIAGEGAGGEYSQDYASSGNVIEQNLFTHASGEYNVQSYWGGPKGTGNVVRSNCVFDGAKGDVDTADGGFTASANKTADPQYVNRAAHDYRLKSGSPCLSVVGYDTAAKLKGADPEPTPTPTPSPSPTPSPTATPGPLPPLPVPPLPPLPPPPPLPQGAALAAAAHPAAQPAALASVSGPSRLRSARPRFRVTVPARVTVHWTLRTAHRRLAHGTRRVTSARTITLRPRIAKRTLRRLRGSRIRLVVRMVRPRVS